MELLLLIIAEFAFALMLPFLVILGDLALAILSLVLSPIFGGAWRRRSAPSPSAPPKTQSGLKVRKLLLVCSAACTAVLCIALLGIFVLNTFFFAPTVAWIAGQVSERGGLEIAFEGVDGNLFDGELSFTNLRTVRKVDDKTSYDIAVDNVNLQIDMISLVSRRVAIEQLIIDGVSGDIWAGKKVSRDPQQDSSRSEVERLRRGFRIGDLKISNSSVRLHRDGVPTASLGIDSLSSSPFRSEYAVFDVFFRSNLKARIDRSRIEIATGGDGRGRKTYWKLSDFPAAFVGHFVETPPFNWFESGDLDIEVEDAWRAGTPPEVDMDWRVTLKDARLVAPDGTGPIARKLAAPVVRYINDRDDEVDLHFSLVMNEDQFKSKSSLDAAGLWSAVLKSLVKEIASATDRDEEETKGAIDNLLDAARGFLDGKRRKPAAEEQVGQD